MVKRISLLLLLVCSIAQAEEVVHYLNVGEPAPYAGFLFTPAKEKELRLLDQTLDNCVSKNKLLTDSFDIQNKIISTSDERVANYQAQIDNLNKQLVSEKTNDFWHNALYFLVGAGLTATISVGLAYGYGRR